MILMRANPCREPLAGVGPEHRDFFGPTPSNGSRNEWGGGNPGPKKSQFSGPRPSNSPRYGRSQKFSIFIAHPSNGPRNGCGGGGKGYEVY
jgi:hypothetical protein